MALRTYLAVGDRIPRKYRLGILVVALVFTTAITWLAIFGVLIERKIPAARIYHSSGFRYFTVVMKPPWPFLVLTNSNNKRNRARTTLYEQNRPLGPPHSKNHKIAALGEGRFLHWHTTLYFSAADNSNPRRNGRKYSVKFSVVIRPVFAMVAYLALLLALLLNANEIKEIGKRVQRRVQAFPRL